MPDAEHVMSDRLLENRLRDIVEQQSLNESRRQVEHLAMAIDVSIVDCAAALLHLHQASPELAHVDKIDHQVHRPGKNQFRSVRYRLDVGSQHQVSSEQVQAILVSESGVDKKRISRIDIRHNYTLVELPDGMPADIFMLLSEATLAGRKLAIKRVKPNRRPRDGGSAKVG